MAVSHHGTCGDRLAAVGCEYVDLGAVSDIAVILPKTGVAKDGLRDFVEASRCLKVTAF